MLKVKKNITPGSTNELFAPKKSPYDLRNNNSFKRKMVNLVWCGTEMVSYLGKKSMGLSTQ